MPDKEYLGDSVYVESKYGEIILTTENGIRTSNRIVLEREVLKSLSLFIANRLGGKDGTP